MDTVALSASVVFPLIALFLMAGVPIGVALGIPSVLGVVIATGNLNAGLSLPMLQSKAQTLNFGFIVIPMFVLMGQLAAESGITGDLFKTASRWVGQFRGGMAFATIAACTGMAAISGSSIATIAGMMPIARPEMKKYGYKDELTIGTITSGGTLSIMIPPSMTLVVYGIFAQQSIGQLLMAGILPGLVIAAAYTVQVLLRVRIWPGLGPAGPRYPMKEKVESLVGVLPFMIIVSAVLFGILFGVWTAVEASATGTIAVLIMGVVRRRLTPRGLFTAAEEAAVVTSVVILLVVGCFIFSQYLAISGLNVVITQAVVGLGLDKTAFFAVLVVFYIILGCFLEIGSIMALTIPIMMPILPAFGWSPIWFGVMMVLFGEIAALTPPVGVGLFTAKAVAPDVPIGTIYKSCFPFWLCNVIVLWILFFFPDLALTLPRLMFK